MPKTILILSVSIGSGHDQAAGAIASALREINPGLDIDILDYVQTNAAVGKPVKAVYLTALKTAPAVYSFLYRESQRRVYRRVAFWFMDRSARSSARKLIERNEPSLIVCTHPFPVPALTRFREDVGGRFKVAVVVTDFTCHSLWFDPRADYYFVAHEGLRQLLIDLGARDDQVIVTGIPIRTPATVTGSAGSPKLPHVLIMAGGLGLGPIAEVVSLLLRLERGIHLTVVTGRNTELKERLDSIAIPARHRMDVYGYTPEVPRLMAEADLLVTKPGGLSCSEALAAQLPMVLFHPVPGQEEDNATFLSEAGVAETAASSDQVVELVRNLLFVQPRRLDAMKKQTIAYAKPQASRLIAETLVRIVTP
ncbi:MAG: MGDG synthase family glycosyltransferase [Bacillota bacterium]